MKKMLKIAAISAALCLLAAVGLCAQQAVIQDFAGTVEIKQANSEVWENAQRGQTLTGDMMISTGFRSTALIALGDSVVTVRPLTRLAITELSRSQNAEKVEINLQAGRVRAEVNAPANGEVDFTVHSSAATASVRGTVFEFDTLNLSVAQGTVEFAGTRGVPVLVDTAGYSHVAESGGRPEAPRTAGESALKPDLPIGAGTARPESGGSGAQSREDDTGSISVQVGF